MNFLTSSRCHFQNQFLQLKIDRFIFYMCQGMVLFLGPIDHQSELVQAMMAWHRVANRLLIKPVMIKFHDAIQDHNAMKINAVSWTKWTTHITYEKQSKLRMFSWKKILINKNRHLQSCQLICRVNLSYQNQIIQIIWGVLLGYTGCHIIRLLRIPHHT